ncbi:hypothetical protein AMELA_G00173170 [Ameiurus melas]|uniref:Uncharacterized protein n=1 Tax=Ameiurus melas TaxID=219545 RepID=A0A7J6ACM6_AMEME|nr:hypothetical protein AMELA_G00173170 [Ameiurus melas]
MHHSEERSRSSAGRHTEKFLGAPRIMWIRVTSRGMKEKEERNEVHRQKGGGAAAAKVSQARKEGSDDKTRGSRERERDLQSTSNREVLESSER